ncbi:MAG: hypothetical protein LAT55_00435 [Opitutales bacterium]|nr:hypothetical protein [Opitutales bacterium]
MKKIQSLAQSGVLKTGRVRHCTTWDFGEVKKGRILAYRSALWPLGRDRFSHYDRKRRLSWRTIFGQ